MTKDNLNLEKTIQIPYALISIFIALSIIILTAGYFYNKKQETAIKTAIHHELNSISKLKAEQIIRWRNERLQLANVIKKSEFVHSLIYDWLANQSDQKLRIQILKWMTIIRDARDFHGVFLLDDKGSLKLVVCDSNGTISEKTSGLLREAMDKNQVIFSNINIHEKEKTVELDVIIPIKMNDKPLGWLIFAVNPYKTLYLAIQSFPIPSSTGEFLLVSQDNSDVVFLNELRHQKDTALKLRFPLSQENLPAVMAVKGKEGIVEGIDYRGSEVIASLTPIQDSPWFLVSKIDKAEAYKNVHEKTLAVMILSILLIISTGLGIGFVWRNQRSQFYRRQYDLEKKHGFLLQRYEYLTRYANDIILILDADYNKIIEANERAVETYGYSNDELGLLHVKDIRAPEAIKFLNGHAKEVKEHGGSVFETLHRRKNGEIFPVEVSSRLIEMNSQNFFFAIVRDITERKQAERRLENAIEELRKLEDIINRSPAVAFLCEVGDGLPLEFISANISMYGYLSHELIIENTPFIKIIYPEDISSFLMNTDKLNKKNINEFILQHRIFNKSGDIYWVENRVWAIFDPSGDITHYQGVLIDITEQKKLLEQLIHAQKMEAVGKLAGGVAHDFNNILTAIIGYGYMMRMKVENDETLKGYADQILASSERASNLTQSLLAFSRKQIINLQPISLNDLIKDVSKLLSRLVSEDIELEIITSDDKLTFMGDKTQLEQVLMNLAVNAKDAMPNGGSLIIETEIIQMNKDYISTHGYGELGAYALLSVTDTGEGISEENKERIFDPFYTTKEIGKGTGLGLSIVYGIIKQHNGYINVYSELGKGTTFKVYLPLVHAEALPKIEEEPVASLSGTETILIAEDEEPVRSLYKEALEAYGYEIIDAEDGEAAVRKFIENQDRIKLLVLDVVMPKKNGKEAYEEIKAIRPDIKALFTSGYTENVIHKKGILDYSYNFLRKPVSPNVLLKKIREVLNS